MINALGKAIYSVEDTSVLSNTADLFFASFGTAVEPYFNSFRSEKRESKKKKNPHRQSSRSMNTPGPGLVKKECEGKRTYGPGSPMITDWYTCFPGASCIPSISTTTLQWSLALGKKKLSYH